MVQLLLGLALACVAAFFLAPLLGLSVGVGLAALVAWWPALLGAAVWGLLLTRLVTARGPADGLTRAWLLLPVLPLAWWLYTVTRLS